MPNPYSTLIMAKLVFNKQMIKSTKKYNKKIIKKIKIKNQKTKNLTVLVIRALLAPR